MIPICSDEAFVFGFLLKEKNKKICSGLKNNLIFAASF
jgi:hypothetical protein